MFCLYDNFIYIYTLGALCLKKGELGPMAG